MNAPPALLPDPATALPAAADNTESILAALRGVVRQAEHRQDLLPAAALACLIAQRSVRQVQPGDMVPPRLWRSFSALIQQATRTAAAHCRLRPMCLLAALPPAEGQFYRQQLETDTGTFSPDCCYLDTFIGMVRAGFIMLQRTYLAAGGMSLVVAEAHGASGAAAVGGGQESSCIASTPHHPARPTNSSGPPEMTFPSAHTNVDPTLLEAVDTSLRCTVVCQPLLSIEHAGMWGHLLGLLNTAFGHRGVSSSDRGIRSTWRKFAGAGLLCKALEVRESAVRDGNNIALHDANHFLATACNVLKQRCPSGLGSNAETEVSTAFAALDKVSFNLLDGLSEDLVRLAPLLDRRSPLLLGYKIDFASHVVALFYRHLHCHQRTHWC